MNLKKLAFLLFEKSSESCYVMCGFHWHFPVNLSLHLLELWHEMHVN